MPVTRGAKSDFLLHGGSKTERVKYMICLNCKEEFESERSTAKYCSAGCRVKHGRLSVTEEGGDSVTNLSVTEKNDLSVTLNLEKDLKLDAGKDLGIFSWTADGIMIRPDITIEQVQRIAKLVAAKHGNPEKVVTKPRDWRKYI